MWCGLFRAIQSFVSRECAGTYRFWGKVMTVTIRLIGLPTDQNSSFARGPALAPTAVRHAIWSERGNLACESGREIGLDIALVDHGDLSLSDHDVAADDALIEAAVQQCADNGEIPLCIGGDHAVSLPVVAALTRAYGPLHILHFDAHPDIYHDFDGNPRSHASPFARIWEGGYCASQVQIGIRTMNRHCREQAERFGIDVLPIAGFAPERVPVLSGPLYVSIDLDGIDPSEAPGVSHPEPGGLTLREVLAVLARQSAPIVGADIVEYNPRFDQHERTAILAAKLVREMADLISRNHRT